MKKRIFMLICLSGLITAGFAQHPVVLKLANDGKTEITKPFQHAIDSCAEAGGGMLILPEGKYLSGPLFLKSKITLKLDTGSVLIASDNFDLYTINKKVVNFINGDSIKGVVITGTGMIDGNGKKWWDEFIRSGKKLVRPRLIYITKSKDLVFEKFTLVNSPSFHLVPQDCKNVVIDNLKFKAPATSPNTDGIDPSRSKNVVISNCTIDVGDDNIAIKAGRSGGKVGASCENIVVSNCTFLHGHGMSIGSETVNGVKNVSVSNCTFDSTDNGIRIKSNITLGGAVENVSYKDIRMTNVKNPILITFDYKSNFNDKITNDIPSVNGFTIENLKITGSKNAGSLIGLENSHLKNIVLKNIKVKAKTGMVIENADDVNLKNIKIQVQTGDTLMIKNVTGQGFEKLNAKVK